MKDITWLQKKQFIKFAKNFSLSQASKIQKYSHFFLVYNCIVQMNGYTHDMSVFFFPISWGCTVKEKIRSP